MNWEVCRATWRHLEIQHASRCPIHPVCINEPSLCNSTQQLQGRRTERGHFILNNQYAVSYIYLIIYAFCIKPKAQAPSPQIHTLKNNAVPFTFLLKRTILLHVLVFIFLNLFSVDKISTVELMHLILIFFMRIPKTNNVLLSSQTIKTLSTKETFK